MNRSGYKQIGEGSKDMGNTVFGREHDSMELMARFGCSGYMQKFYEFLQGKFHPEKIMDKDAPNLSGDQAWHVIYCMQEYFGIFDDRFERCRECVHGFTEEEYGHYCEDCRPD